MRTQTYIVAILLSAALQAQTDSIPPADHRREGVSSAGPSALVQQSYLLPPVGYSGGVNALSAPAAPVTCAPVNQPYSNDLHYGGLLCSGVPAPPAPVDVDVKYIDPAFGGVSIPLTRLGVTMTHGYSLPTPISAKNRYVNVTDHNGRHYVLDRQQSGNPLIPIVATSGAVMWDPVRDDVYYYLEGVGPKVIKVSIQAQTYTVVADYSGRFSQINNGGSTHNSADNWTSFWSQAEHAICALNLENGRTFCADYTAPQPTNHVGWDFLDYSVITDVDKGTGKRYVMLVATPAMGVWSVNVQEGRLDYESRGPELTQAQGFNNGGNNDLICDPNENCLSAPHGDVTAYDGIQYFLTAVDLSINGCGRELVLFPIAQLTQMVARRTTVLPISYCSSAYEWPEIHYGCSLQTGACVISTHTVNPAPYGNQLLLLRDPTHLTRLAYHNSVQTGSDTYWYFARSGISVDGRYVVYDSNWGRPDEGVGTSSEQVFIMGIPNR